MLSLRHASGLRHFARVVAPRRWESVFVQMLSGCFDGGGKQASGHRVISVAGLCSFSRPWDEFEQRWTARLMTDGLSAFHAADLAHSVREFAGWKGDERRRRALCRDLMAIIRQCGLRKFGSVVTIEDYVRSNQKYGFDPDGTAFAFCGMKCAEAFTEYAHSIGVRENLEYLFEKGGPEQTLRDWFTAFGFTDPNFRWKTVHFDRMGTKHHPFVGLQAADWIAYEYYLASDRRIYEQFSAEDRWAITEFQAMPGSVIVTTTPNSEELYSRNREIQKLLHSPQGT